MSELKQGKAVKSFKTYDPKKGNSISMVSEKEAKEIPVMDLEAVEEVGKALEEKPKRKRRKRAKKD